MATEKKKIAIEYDPEKPMTKHEYEQSIAAQMPPLQESGFDRLKKSLINLMDISDNEYFMLLSKPLSYYTIFHCKPTMSYDEAGAYVLRFLRENSFLSDLGPIVDFDDESDLNAIEIWYQGNHFLFFPADNFVVSCDDEEV